MSHKIFILQKLKTQKIGLLESLVGRMMVNPNRRKSKNYQGNQQEENICGSSHSRHDCPVTVAILLRNVL